MTEFTGGVEMGTVGRRDPEVSGEVQLVYPPWLTFRKEYWAHDTIGFSTLVFDVFTSYNDRTVPLADVRINGITIGQVPPRGTQQTGGELAPVAFQFANNILNYFDPPTPFRGGNSRNSFEIVPGSAYDYLYVGNWRVHFNQYRT